MTLHNCDSDPRIDDDPGVNESSLTSSFSSVFILPDHYTTPPLSNTQLLYSNTYTNSVIPTSKRTHNKPTVNPTPSVSPIPPSPSSPSSSSSSSSSSSISLGDGDVWQRLNHLQSLQTSGVISQQEYNKTTISR